MCFLKLNPVALVPGNINTEVIYGDFGDVPLEHLSVLAQEVFLPMLCNPRNQVGWPEVGGCVQAESSGPNAATYNVTDVSYDACSSQTFVFFCQRRFGFNP